MEKKTRLEHDSLGEVEVDAERLYGAQTERSRLNFHISNNKMPAEIISALALIKKACAQVNRDTGKLCAEKAAAISDAADAIIANKFPNEFPLSVWQTGSGTQTNMNVNEVISHIAPSLHPNDDVNMSQSSNDVFPSAMSIAALLKIKNEVCTSANALADAFRKLEEREKDIIKIGRTHFQDAVPLRFSDEVSGWRSSIEASIEMLDDSCKYLSRLALGGTAVGTGIGTPAGFDEKVCAYISKETGFEFTPDKNKFHALSSKDAFVFAHGALKALAANLIKIAGDIRILSSGPRCGIGEINIPQNEPGSSIMPGKVNPTQCEALTMVGVQVTGNDAAVAFAASQGILELNVYMPLIAFDTLWSCDLLSGAMDAFRENCVCGITANREKIKQNLENSLMLVTALTGTIGYDAAAKIALNAHRKGITLRESALALGLCDADTFDRLTKPENMI